MGQEQGVPAGMGVQFYGLSRVAAARWERFLRLALERLVSLHLAGGQVELVEQYARRQLALEPWSESGHQALMLALALAGQRGAALAQYESCRRLLAEELDADWSRVKAEFAPADPAYFNPMFGRQATGGSTATRAYWTPLRTAGATAREVLVQAAAQNWGVEPSDCHTQKGEVIHEASGRKLSYGELAGAAAKLPVPEMVFLKEPEDFVLLGKPLPRLDTPLKVDGSAEFGMDVRLPGMLTATVARFGGLGGLVPEQLGPRRRDAFRTDPGFQLGEGWAVRVQQRLDHVYALPFRTQLLRQVLGRFAQFRPRGGHWRHLGIGDVRQAV